MSCAARRRWLSDEDPINQESRRIRRRPRAARYRARCQTPCAVANGPPLRVERKQASGSPPITTRDGTHTHSGNPERIVADSEIGLEPALTANIGNSGSSLQFPRDEEHQHGRSSAIAQEPPTSCERRIALPTALAWLVPTTTRSFSSSRSNLAAPPRQATAVSRWDSTG